MYVHVFACLFVCLFVCLYVCLYVRIRALVFTKSVIPGALFKNNYHASELI